MPTDVFKILFLEMGQAVDRLKESQVDSANDDVVYATDNIEIFVGESVSFLLRFNDLVGCVDLLSEPKWLTLILNLLHASPAHIERRILRLLRHVLPEMHPERLQCILPESTNKVGAFGLVNHFLKFIARTSAPIGHTVRECSTLHHPLRAATLSSDSVSL